MSVNTPARRGLLVSLGAWLYSRRYDAGVAGSLEVTDAQTRLERARDNQTAALFQYNVARVDLAQACSHWISAANACCVVMPLRTRRLRSPRSKYSIRMTADQIIANLLDRCDEQRRAKSITNGLPRFSIIH